MSLWNASEAAAATGGTVQGAWNATGVSIDSRSLRPGDLFVALKDQRDGHDFVAAALEAGAAAALVSHRPEGIAADAPLLLVPDVLQALQALARAARARSRARAVAITGSMGKTSTKEMLRLALRSLGPVHAAEASFNNHWGVPLTLARLPREAAVAVIEIGMNHAGEIAPLARLARPDVAVVTNVSGVHLEFFDSVEAIAREKAAIFEGLSPGGSAVINADQPVRPLLEAAAEAAGARLWRFGQAAGAEVQVTGIRLAAGVTVVEARVAGRPMLWKLGAPGRHFALNSAAVMAAALALGADPALVALDLAAWTPPAGRGLRQRVLLDPFEDLWFDLIDDAFNANPVSMAAALEVLVALQGQADVGRLRRPRHIAVLGDMLELGPDELEQHAALATLPALARVQVVHCVGPRMRALYDRLPPTQRGEWHPQAEPLAARARALVDAGDVVLVKGSKGSRVSLVVEALRRLGQPPLNGGDR